MERTFAKGVFLAQLPEPVIDMGACEAAAAFFETLLQLLDCLYGHSPNLDFFFGAGLKMFHSVNPGCEPRKVWSFMR
jgi:hypothetical protein